MGRRIQIDGENCSGVIPGLTLRYAFDRDALDPEIWSKALRWCEASVVGDWGAYISGMFGIYTTDVRFGDASDAERFAAAFPVRRLSDQPDVEAEFEAALKGVCDSDDQLANRKKLFDHMAKGGRSSSMTIRLGGGRD